MARPKKEGLDYFPLDVDMDQDDKIALIEAKHGLVGFSIVIKLLMKVYKNSYFYEWGEKEQLLFASRINVDINSIQEVISDCINFGLFCKEAYENHSILTSKGIQERYIEAIVRRREVTFIKEYLLINPEKYVGNSRIKLKMVDVDRNLINVDINSNNENINPQSQSQSKSQSQSNSKRNKRDDDKEKLNTFSEYEKNFGIIPPIFQNDVDYWLDNSSFEEPEQIIIEVINRAKEHKPKNPAKYLNTMLKNLHEASLFTLKQVQEHYKQNDRKKDKKSVLDELREEWGVTNE